MSRETVNKGFDVRINMLALLVINSLVLTGKGGVFQLACAVVIGLLLMLQRRGLAAGLFALCMSVMQLLPPVMPVLREEAQAIRGAMRLRGIPGRGGVLLHPWRALEYFLIPLIAALLRSAEALSAVALSRGLGSPGVASSVVPLRMSA